MIIFLAVFAISIFVLVGTLFFWGYKHYANAVLAFCGFSIFLFWGIEGVINEEISVCRGVHGPCIDYSIVKNETVFWLAVLGHILISIIALVVGVSCLKKGLLVEGKT